MAFGGAMATATTGKRPIDAFTLGPEHLPLPFEEILEWLRGLPIVRLIEVDYWAERT